MASWTALSRDRVERWLADHPEGLGEVQSQRSFSPANAGLWDRARPPEPSEQEWARRRNGMRVDSPRRPAPASPERPVRRWRGAWALAGLAAAGVAAAAAMWVALGPGLPGNPKNEPNGRAEARWDADRAASAYGHPRCPARRSIDGIEGFATLPIATDDDVVLERVPEFPAGWLPVGRHPLEGTMALATVEELLLAEVEPSSMWPTGSPKMTTSPSDAPMIYAAKLR